MINYYSSDSVEDDDEDYDDAVFHCSNKTSVYLPFLVPDGQYIVNISEMRIRSIYGGIYREKDTYTVNGTRI